MQGSKPCALPLGDSPIFCDELTHHNYFHFLLPNLINLSTKLKDIVTRATMIILGIELKK